MSNIPDLIKKVALFDEGLAQELQVQMRRAGLAPLPVRMEELEFLLKNKIISKREVLRRMNPEMAEEEIGALVSEAERENLSMSPFQIIQVPYTVPNSQPQPQPYVAPNTGSGTVPGDRWTWSTDTIETSPSRFGEVTISPNPQITWTFNTYTLPEGE